MPKSIDRLIKVDRADSVSVGRLIIMLIIILTNEEKSIVKYNSSRHQF